ncbi:hypothetical protein [Vibrio sonorensis]|uniref:hypothetical protein n=1 Tax=Vibrio sonorensis TaxID=1004316 RepID=UPI0008DA81CA|nr:hypothetical protein [Vibrio sonorensis]
MTRTYDLIAAALILCLTLVLVAYTINTPWLLDWAFERHQNLLSWYIRPVLLLPICFFAYKRSLTGICLSFLALLTSMVWFPVPDSVDPNVAQFLAMEIEYLTSPWNLIKIILSLSIPVFMGLLCIAFWYRSIRFGVLLMLAMAGLKVIWSINQGGHSGLSTIVPAFVGFALCVIGLLAYSRYTKTDKS